MRLRATEQSSLVINLQHLHMLLMNNQTEDIYLATEKTQHVTKHEYHTHSLMLGHIIIVE